MMALEGLGTITSMVENICEVIKKKEEVKKMILKIVVGIGIVATVAAGAYTIYKFVVKKNEEDEALECDKDECPAIETKAEEPAEACACGCEQKAEAAEEVKEEAAKEQ